MRVDDFIYWNQQWIQFLILNKKERLEYEGVLYFELETICKAAQRGDIPEIFELYDYILAVLKLFCQISKGRCNSSIKKVKKLGLNEDYIIKVLKNEIID